MSTDPTTAMFLTRSTLLRLRKVVELRRVCDGRGVGRFFTHTRDLWKLQVLPRR